jgi:TPR repeat protein
MTILQKYCTSDDLPETPTQQQQSGANDEAQREYELGLSNINSTTKAAVNYRVAYQHLKRATDLGHIGAKEELARFYLFGYHVQRNITHSRLLFEDVLKSKSSSSAQFFLGFLHSNGLSIKSNQAKSLLYLTFGALGGDFYAQMAIGYRYANFRSVDLDNRESIFEFFDFCFIPGTLWA